MKEELTTERPKVARLDDLKDADLTEPEDGWAGLSLTKAMRVTVVAAHLVGQAVLALAGLGSTTSVDPRLLLYGHLLAIVVGLAALISQMPVGFFVALCFLLVAIDHVVAVHVDEPLFTVAFIITPWIVTTPILTFEGLRPVVWCAIFVLGVGVGIEVAHPGWPESVVASSVISNVALGAAAIMFIRGLRSFASGVDRHEQDAAKEERRAAEVRASHEAAVEYTRVLHDTVVNTLGALARDEAAQQYSPAVVRARCAHDVQRLAALTDRRPGSFNVDFFDFDGAGLLPIRRTGMTGGDLREYQAHLPQETLAALHGCIRELLVNATKHSGADHVRLDARLEGQDLIFEVTDNGCGFSGRIIDGHGLRRSVFDRAHRHGIHVELQTAPGSGTAVKLRYRMSREPLETPPSDPGPAKQHVDRFLDQMFWTWTALMIMVAVITETAGRSAAFTLAHLMLALLLGAVCVTVWINCRGGRSAPRALTVAVITAIPVTTILALEAVEFGRSQPHLFQVGALSAIVVMPLIMTKRARPFVVALCVYAASVLAAGGYVLRQDPTLVPMTLTLGAPLFALATAWSLFHWSLTATARHLSWSWQRTREAAVTIAAYEAATSVLERWNRSGLQDSIELLTKIAEGEASVCDPDVRRWCGREEHHLRQISSLPSDAALMSWWFALALAQARAREIQLHLQVGGATISCQQEADALGRFMLTCLSCCARESTLVVTLVQHRGAARILMLGIGDLGVDLLRRGHGHELDIHCEAVGRQVLVEATWIAEAA